MKMTECCNDWQVLWSHPGKPFLFCPWCGKRKISDLKSEIHEKISNKIEVNVGMINPFREKCFKVDIPLSFGDGDQCRFFISKTTDGWLVSDGGSTIMRASFAGDVDVLDEAHIDRFKQIITFYGISESDGELTALAPDFDLGDVVFGFAQAAIEIVQLGN